MPILKNTAILKVVNVGFKVSGPADTSYTNTKSIVFDGDDEYLDITSDDGTTASTFGGTGGFTAAIWFKTTATSNQTPFNRWDSGAPRDWFISFSTSGNVRLYMRRTDGTSITNLTSTAYNDGNWHLVIVGWDAVDTIFCDMDGGVERKNMAGASSRMGTSGEATNIGGYQEWDGNLDEPTYWDKGLSAAECVELYNSGVPMDPRNHSAASNLVAWWRMGDDPLDSTDSGDPAARIYDQVGSNNATPVNMESADIVEDVP